MAPVLFVIATAVLALWVDVRFPGLTPAEVMRTGIHMGIAFVASTVAAPIVLRRRRSAPACPWRGWPRWRSCWWRWVTSF